VWQAQTAKVSIYYKDFSITAYCRKKKDNTILLLTKMGYGI